MQQALDHRQRKLATWLQEKTLRVNRQTLIAGLLGVGIICCIACSYLLWHGITQRKPLEFIAPIRPPLLELDSLRDTIH